MNTGWIYKVWIFLKGGIQYLSKEFENTQIGLEEVEIWSD